MNKCLTDNNAIIVSNEGNFRVGLKKEEDNFFFKEYPNNEIYNIETIYTKKDDKLYNPYSGLCLSLKGGYLFISNCSDALAYEDIQNILKNNKYLSLLQLKEKIYTLENIKDVKYIKEKNEKRSKSEKQIDLFYKTLEDRFIPKITLIEFPKIAILLSGSSGAGKSYFTKKFLSKEIVFPTHYKSKNINNDLWVLNNIKQYIIIDYDELIPEFEITKFAQENCDINAYSDGYKYSAKVYERLTQKCIEKGLPVIIQSVVTDEERVKQLVKTGYHIFLLYFKNDDEKSEEQRSKRGREKNLYVKTNLVDDKTVKDIHNWIMKYKPNYKFTISYDQPTKVFSIVE